MIEWIVGGILLLGAVGKKLAESAGALPECPTASF